jgi:RNA methyltransferase, TrmH family
MREHSSPARNLRQPELITSRQNQWLRRFRQALAGDHYRAEAWVGVEGARMVEEALRSGLAVQAVLVSESGRCHLAQLAPHLPATARLLATSDSGFERVADTQSPQGIAALVRPRTATFDDLLHGPGAPLVVVLCGVQDPGNVGTILRAAEALGASGAAACAAGAMHTARVFSPKVLRASAGAALRFPVVEGLAAPVLMAQLRVSGVPSLAAASSQSQASQPARAPWEMELRGAVAIFIGNEGSGLPGEVERSADALAHIPMVPASRSRGAPVQSLNAATAAAILLYEAARQRASASHTPDDQHRAASPRVPS